MNMREIGPGNSSKLNPVSHGGNSYRFRAGVGLDLRTGEAMVIRILDYLGRGRYVIDLKGQRVVARALPNLQENQKLNVVVRNDDGKIILQVVYDNALETGSSGSQRYAQSINVDLGVTAQELVLLLERISDRGLVVAEPESRDILEETWQLLNRIFVDPAQEDVSGQVRESLRSFGYDLEQKLAVIAANGGFAKNALQDMLKPYLLARR